MLETGLISLGSVDLSLVADEIIALIPKVLPALITVLAVRKGISFLLKSLRGA